MPRVLSLLLVLLFCGAAPLSAQDPIEDARRALRQPGPEAKQEREQAVDALLLMADPAAHGVLAEIVRDGADEDGVAAFVLASLARRWQQRADPVFGVDDEPRRRLLLRVHVPAVVRLAGADGPLQEAALACLRALSGAERQALFRELLATEADDELVRRALTAASLCRDLGLASSIADLLEHPEFGKHAGDALATLVFAPEPFRSRAAFESWREQNGQRTYVELAERAGRGVQAVVRERARAHAAALRAVRVRLIVSMLRAREVDWRGIQQELTGEDSVELMPLALAEMRRELGGRREFAGSSADRITLAQALEQRLANAANPAEEAQLIEVVAQLRAVASAAGGEENGNAELIAMLSVALERDEPVVQRAALRSLAIYPSARSRAAIVAAATRALEREPQRTEVATEALRALAAPGQTAPELRDADRVAWRELLRRVLEDASLPVQIKELASEVAVSKDRAGMRSADGFELLRGAVLDGTQSALFRKQAMIRWRAFTEDPDRAAAYVATLCTCLDDEDPLVRAAAAEQLQRVPEGGSQQRTAWIGEVRSHVAPRIRVETDPRALELANACLRATAEPPGDAGAAIGRFVDIADQLTRPQENGAAPVEEDPALAALRRQLVAESLQLLGGSPGRTTGEWLAAGRALAALRARDALRSVLTRQKGASLMRDGSDPAERRAVAELVLAAARLAPSEPSWDTRRSEAQEVEAALGILASSEGWQPAAIDRRLHVEVLLGQGKASEARAIGQAALDASDVPLDATTRSAVLLAVAMAAVRGGEWAEAEARLRELQASGAPHSSVVHGVWLDVASGYLEGGVFDRALAAAEELRDRLTEGSEMWARALLIRQEARFRSDPVTFGPVVQRELESARAVFEADTLPERLRTRFERLVEEVRGR
jgi:hypothetical protein